MPSQKFGTEMPNRETVVQVVKNGILFCRRQYSQWDAYTQRHHHAQQREQRRGREPVEDLPGDRSPVGVGRAKVALGDDVENIASEPHQERIVQPQLLAQLLLVLLSGVVAQYHVLGAARRQVHHSENDEYHAQQDGDHHDETLQDKFVHLLTSLAFSSP